MKVCPLCGIEKDASGYHKSQSRCIECRAEMQREYRKENHDEVTLKRKEYHAATKERRGKRYIKNKESILKKQKEYHAKHPDKMRSRVRKWRKENPGKANAITAKRHAQKLSATPQWADSKEIATFYKEAHDIECLTGIKVNVDHIVPLQGETVCGLHCSGNLQIMWASDNGVKGNRHWPDM